ncbi:polyadenylate-binding protein-interacting protein 2, isoform CRA_a [Mus musculus]|uniref:Polyadenylate-binding protein-interacting protein 2 n=1 Tax=Rattus norvegicus TaxID=10116 RepID=A6J2Y4_RAT|nr:polyadenylate-binding protein-interacting protein 2, isoform CRA_a [Mus musculus]EDL76265.1 rCG49211, isoform CRA_b [Rattus norvegicus]
MKDPSRSSTSPSIINDDVIINGHSHEEDNPFAEYMWMENEEEFNRQVKSNLNPNAKEFVPGVKY